MREDCVLNLRNYYCMEEKERKRERIGSSNPVLHRSSVYVAVLLNMYWKSQMYIEMRFWWTFSVSGFSVLQQI